MKWIVFTWYNCNESCFFCSAEVHGRKSINRSFMEIAHDIEIAKQQWVTEIEFIGWEVLIRPDALLIIGFAKKKNFSIISVETNGTALSDVVFCEKILSLGLNKITLSIHGASAGMSDKHTGLVGSYDQKLLWLKNLQSFHKKYQFSIATNYVVTSQNIVEVEKFIQLMDQFTMLEKYIFAFVRPLRSYNKLYKHYLPQFQDIKKIFESFPIHPKLSIQYLPLCILSERHRKEYQSMFIKWKKIDTEKSNSKDDKIILEWAIQSDMEYIDGCENCKFYGSCRWVWKEYVDFFQIKKLPLLPDGN